MKLPRLLSSVRFGPLHFLLLLITALACTLAWQWVDERAQWRNIAWLAPKPLLPEVKPLQVLPAAAPAQYASILERPLFAPDRRPPPPPAPPPPPDPLADIQLLGLFSGANGGLLARIEGKVRRVKVNETVGPWTLKSVDGRDATFAQGTDSRQLRLAYARIDTPAAPTAAQAATAAARPAGLGAPGAGAPVNIQDEGRERTRRRNEIRAARGLPPITD